MDDDRIATLEERFKRLDERLHAMESWAQLNHGYQARAATSAAAREEQPNRYDLRPGWAADAPGANAAAVAPPLRQGPPPAPLAPPARHATPPPAPPGVSPSPVGATTASPAATAAPPPPPAPLPRPAAPGWSLGDLEQLLSGRGLA